MWPEDAIYLPWWIWIASWMAASFWSNPTLKRPGGTRQWPYQFLELSGFAVLLLVHGQDSTPFREGLAAHNVLAQRYWALPPAAGWTMVALEVVGFAFCWWARIHLGRLWSGTITHKQGHRVVSSGPYRIVRHPIYTGLILAAAATAAEKASGAALLGLGLVIAGYWMKSRLEERFLREELGASAYDAYAARTPMLIPFVKA